MNERQRDNFLWIWSRRRQRGRLNAAIAGGVIGLLGGAFFTLLFFGMPDFGAQPSAGALNTDLLAAHQADLARRIGDRNFVMVLACLFFTPMGFLMAWNVFGRQEAMYQSLLAQGARVPDQQPELTLADKGPLIAVLVVAGLIAAGIAALFIWQYAR